MVPPATTRPGRRVEWIDALRGLAVFLVAIYHVWVHIPAGFRPVGMSWLDSVLGNYRMPALMFTSGLLLDLSLRKPTEVYIAGKLRAIVWPWFLWTAVMVMLIGQTKYDQLHWWLNGTHTWYLMALTTSFAIALLFRRVPHWIIALTLLAVALLLKEYGDSMVAGIAQRWLWNGWFFFAGAAMADRWQYVAKSPRWAVGLGFAVTIVWSGWRLHLGTAAGRSILTATMAIIGILLLIWVLVHLPDSWLLRSFKWIGENSIVTYLAHWPAVIILYRVMGSPTGWPGFLLVSTGTIAVCVLLTWLRPWTNWLYRFPLPTRQKAPVVS